MSKIKPFRSVSALLVALCLALSTVPAMAQSQASTGQITGSVVDSTGALVPGATVKATNNNTGLERKVTTGDDGLYTLVLLPPGTYTLTGEASGFSTTTVTNVEVVVGRTVDVKINLSASGVQEEVQVSAGAVQVQTTRPEADAVLNEKAIDNLPINGRRFQDFITLTPSAQVEPRRQQISLSGQLGIHSNINVDGVDYNQPFFGGIRGGERSNNAYTIPQEAIKEFQVVAAGYSAEFGRSTGGIVNAVTKSGTNDFHGSAFYLYRPKKLARDNDFINALELNLSDPTGFDNPTGPLVDIAPAPTQHQFGGSFGGPLKKDKIFFFAAYEQQRVRQTRQVLFDALSGFTPTSATQEAFDFFESLQTPFIQTNDANAVLGRVDYEINNSNRFNIRYSFSRNEALNAVSNGVPLFPTITNALSNNGTEKDRSHTVVGQLTSFFSTSMVNELRSQFSRETRPRLSNEESPTVETTIGRFGTVSFLPTTEFDWRIQIADNLTYSHGGHTFKFGGEYNRTHADQAFGFSQFGRFIISRDTVTTLDVLGLGGSTANRFDSTAVTYLKQIGNLQAAFNTNEVAFFGQDAWRVLPNLTLNFGLRWEGQYNPDPELGNDALINLIKGFPFPSKHNVDPTRIDDDTNNFGPRFGFAYDPAGDGKTVIRGFAGIYYSRTPALLIAGPLNNFRIPAGDLSIALPLRAAPGNPNASANTVYKQLKLIGIDLNTFSLGNLPNISAEQIQQIATLLGVDPFTAGLQPILMATGYENPRSNQAGIGVEREISRGLTVGADFTYVHTLHLQQNRDVNIPEPRIRATDPAQRPFFGLRSGTPRPIPTLGSIQIRESTGKSLYRALTLRSKFQRRWGQVNLFYVRGKALSSTDNERESGGVQYENAFDVNSEYGLSNLDIKHQFLANPIIFLPWGIDVASAIRLRSGRPIDAVFGSDANEDIGGSDRPFSAPGVPFERNMFRNRAIYNIDFRVQKRVQLSENKRLIFSAEFFNIFNFNNIELAGTTVTRYCDNAVGSSSAPLDCGFSSPTNPNFLQLRDMNPASKRFGKLLLSNNSGDPFQVQLGARFQF